VPWLLLALLSGALVDRWDRREVVHVTFGHPLKTS
jgi:hypothetical protein